ncbi:hypothetical protein [Azohydromonas lata]|uniref:hypothetical protein n=1 Tax=Azohydromonas lata TaxID=45677 RepID=UPI00082C4352|nr:hypothetical protein [Azohydromonas lata]
MSTAQPITQFDLAHPRLKPNATTRSTTVATRSKKTKSTTTEPAGEAAQADLGGETMQTIGEAIADATSAGLMPEAGDEPKDPSTTVAEDPEWGTDGHAEAFMLGRMIDVAKRHFTTLAEPWSRLRENEQAAVLSRLHESMKVVVKDAVQIISANARVTFRAEVAGVNFKSATDVEAKLKLVNNPETHALADVAGGFVTVVIENIDELLAVPESALKGEPDNGSLFDKSVEGTALDTEPEEAAA